MLNWKFYLDIITAIFLLIMMPQNILFNYNQDILKWICVLMVDLVCVLIIISSIIKLFNRFCKAGKMT
jgi:hypothetical protein